MQPERWRQIEALYHAALECEPAARLAFLEEACAGDKDLRGSVTALLAYDDATNDFIEKPALELAAQAFIEEQTTLPLQGQTGQQLGAYQLQELLGRGGMGEVYLAVDTRLQRKVAIKLLPARFTTDADRVRRFAQEARAASALNHPNILTIHEIGEIENTHYIVTEYVAGETLRQRMTAAPHKQLQVTEVLRIIAQMAEALAAAHEAGIIHRDIKPENVMVRPDGYVKVLDFGLAKLTEPNAPTDLQAATLASLTEAGVVMGTPRYMSPEQACGEKVDVRTDIFSLGVLLYEMVAGHAPFSGATASEIIAAILRDEPAPLDAPEAAPELQQIIHRALQKKRAERYQTAQELLMELKRLQRHLVRADGTQELATPPEKTSGGDTAIEQPHSTKQLIPAQASPTRWQRHKWLVVCACVALLSIAAAWFYFRRPIPLPGKDTVLLADFTNQTGDDVFDGMLKLGLATQLGQSPFLNVFPEARVRQTLRQMERTDDTRITPELAQEICERQNLKAFISGVIAPLGSHYVITLAALRGSNGEELTRAQATAASKEHVLQALTEVAAQLRAKLGESLSSIQQSDQPLEQQTTGNLQALKAFSASWNLNISGRNIEAIPFAKLAIERDPQFTMAYDQLAISCMGTDQPEAAAEYQAKIVRLQEERAAQGKYPVSEGYKLDIATWYERLVTGNLNKSLEILQVRRQLSPRSFPTQNDVGVGYVLIGQSEQALTPFNETIRLNRNFAAQYKWLALALIRLNRFAEAKNTITQGLDLKFDMTSYHTYLYQLAFIGADTAGMQPQVDWAQGRPDEYVALDWQTGAAAFAGQWRAAQDFSRRAIELAVHGDNREVAARYATEQALRSAVLGYCQMSKTSATQGLTFGRGRLPLARAALALALCGAAAQAQTLSAELAKRFPEDTLSQEVWLPAIRAALSLQRNDAAQALEQLRNTSRYEAVAEFWPLYLRGQAYLQLKKSAEAAAEFQKILHHQGYAPLSLLYPLAQLGLARATMLTGDMINGRNIYEGFKAAWKAADADLPVLLEAKKEFEQK